MRIYYYLLYRLYTTLSKNNAYNAKEINYLVTVTSTLFIFITLYTIWSIVCLYLFSSVGEIIGGKYSIVFFLVLIASFNYYYIKNNFFLHYSFKNDKMGGYFIFVYLIFILFIFILTANKNREKIRKENERIKIENIR